MNNKSAFFMVTFFNKIINNCTILMWHNFLTMFYQFNSPMTTGTNMLIAIHVLSCLQ